MLCLILAVYAFTVFGYVTAAIATFFVDLDAEDDQASLASAKSIEAFSTEISLLRTEIQALYREKPEP